MTMEPNVFTDEMEGETRGVSDMCALNLTIPMNWCLFYYFSIKVSIKSSL